MSENSVVFLQNPDAVADVLKIRPELSTKILNRITLFAQRLEAAPEPDRERYLPMLTDAVDEYVAAAIEKGSNRETAMNTVGAMLRRQMPTLSQEILDGKYGEAAVKAELASSASAEISENPSQVEDHDSIVTAAEPQPSAPESVQQPEVVKKEQEKPPGEATVSEFFYNGYLGPESHQSTMFVALNQGEKPSLKAYEVMAKHKPSERRMKIIPEADGVTFSFVVDVDSDGTGTRRVNENLAIKMKNVDPTSFVSWGEELSQIVFRLIEERDGRQKLLDNKNLVEVLSGELLDLQQRMRKKTSATEAGRS